MDARDIILRPVVTEKSMNLMDDKKYTFDVLVSATKTQVRNAVEEIFDVKVKNVNIMNVRGKEKRVGRYTGRARQGSIRAPQWRGGGTVFGPTPRSYKMDMPRKARRLAMKSVLSQKVADKDLIIFDQLTLEAPKTKELKAILDNANVSGKVLVVSDDKNVQLSGKNLPKVKVVPVNGLNVVDAVDYQKLVLTQDAIKRIEEVLA